MHFHMEMWVSGSHKVRAMGEGGKMNSGISAPEDPQREGSFLSAENDRQVNLLPDPDAATLSSEEQEKSARLRGGRETAEWTETKLL